LVEQHGYNSQLSPNDDSSQSNNALNNTAQAPVSKERNFNFDGSTELKKRRTSALASISNTLRWSFGSLFGADDTRIAPIESMNPKIGAMEPDETLNETILALKKHQIAPNA
jgi:hypothetical protein